jgi:hypothetical protein
LLFCLQRIFRSAAREPNGALLFFVTFVSFVVILPEPESIYDLIAVA